MKKLNALLAFGAALCLALTGCGSSDDDDDSEEKKTKASASSAADEGSDSDSKEDPSADDDDSDSKDEEPQAPTDIPVESEPENPPVDISTPDESKPDESTPDAPKPVETPQGISLTKDSVIGEWSSTKMIFIYDGGTSEEQEAEGAWRSYFYEDGTGVLEAVALDDRADFLWQISGNTMTLTELDGDDDDIVTGCIESNGTLVLYDDEMQILFELTSKVPGQPTVGGSADTYADLAANATKPTEADLVGSWKSSAMSSDGEYYTADDPDYGEMIKDVLALDIQSGGKGRAITDGEENDLTWKIDGYDTELTVEGDTIKALYVSGQLVLDLYGDGDLLLYMDKK
ncbi:MAG: hypothetical protein IJ746_05690 [Ruminococcus sp.]|nr:hypothetical protein [Ruminococcus sp.]